MANITKEMATSAGYKLNGSLLVEQSTLTRELARAELDQFGAEGLLQQEHLDLVATITDSVHKCLQDRKLAETEKHLKTEGQKDLVRQLKEQRRRLNRCVDRALRGDPSIQNYRQGTYQGSSVPMLLTDVRKKLAFAGKFANELSKVGAPAAFLDKMMQTVVALEAQDASQESAIARLPESTRAFCEAKGRLYFAMKDINDAGHALHAADPELAAKYNMKILYGRGKRGKVKTQGEEAK